MSGDIDSLWKLDAWCVYGRRMLDGNYKGFDIETHDLGIAVFTFNQPEKMNGIGGGMKRDLREVLVQAQLDGDTRVVVITGSGTSFSAGDNIFSMRDPGEQTPTLVPPRHGAGPRHNVDQQSSLQLYSQELIRTLWMLDKPTVAAVNGVAIQTGLSIALACDFRIASTQARLGSATLRFAFLPDEGGHWLLLQLLGLAKATDFLLRKRIVAAAEALELGLVSEVVPHDEMLGRAMELAVELAEGPQVAMRFLKRSLRNAVTLSFEQAGEDIASKTAISDHHPDTAEGVAAWRERRPAAFNQWLTEPQDSPTPSWADVAQPRPPE